MGGASTLPSPFAENAMSLADLGGFCSDNSTRHLIAQELGPLPLPERSIAVFAREVSESFAAHLYANSMELEERHISLLLQARLEYIRWRVKAKAWLKDRVSF